MERNIQVAIISEPYRISRGGQWAVDRREVCAIFHRGSSPLTWDLLTIGDGFVLARIGDIVVASVYFSPNRTLRSFALFLRKFEACIERLRCQEIVIGVDMNARSTMWGDRLTCPRGELVKAWADSLELTLLNKGRTCSKGGGGSIVDVTWCFG